MVFIKQDMVVFHKSIKFNIGLAHPPTHTVKARNNHFSASIYAFFKLELLCPTVSLIPTD